MQIGILSHCHYDRNETILLTGTSSYSLLLFFSIEDREFPLPSTMRKTVGETLLNPLFCEVAQIGACPASPPFFFLQAACLSRHTYMLMVPCVCVFMHAGLVRMAVVSAESRGEQREGPLWWHVKVMSHSLISFIKNKAAILIFVWCL